MDDEVCRAIRERTLRRRRESPLFKNLHYIAGGIDQVPVARATGELHYLSGCDDLLAYHDIFQRNMGTFYRHYSASIPFVIEEQCRVGVGICRLAQRLTRNTDDDFITFREMSVGDGANGRTMAEFSKGLIRTLSDSSSVHNRNNFDNLCNHDYSRFHHGSFIEVTPEYIASTPDLSCFRNGFNVIYENVTFQFYGPEREDLIGYVARLLKEDGLMIFLEKLKHADEVEYRSRERIKDAAFKSNYFTDDKVHAKRVDMLGVMEQGQVNFEFLINSIKRHFRYVYLIWNSTNFYEFAASNNATVLSDFLSALEPIYVPSEFCFEKDMPRSV
jgi:tRNA (cmo5U34)-methyltransferase